MVEDPYLRRHFSGWMYTPIWRTVTPASFIILAICWGVALVNIIVTGGFLGWFSAFPFFITGIWAGPLSDMRAASCWIMGWNAAMIEFTVRHAAGNTDWDQFPFNKDA